MSIHKRQNTNSSHFNMPHSKTALNGDYVPKQRGFWDDLVGVEVLQDLHRDAKIVILAKVIRMFSFGFLSVMLVVYLRELRIPDSQIGLLLTLTLLGDMLVSLLITSHADKWGRRKSLVIGSILSIFSGIVFSFSRNYEILLLSAILGVISPSGHEVGPFVAIELSSLAQVTREQDRTRLMGWYNLFSFFAAATGALFCGDLISFLQSRGHSNLRSYQVVMVLYTACQFTQLRVVAWLSSAIEVPSSSVTNASVKNMNPISLFLGLHKSKIIVLKLSLLFMLDSFAGAFVLQSLISAWFDNKYKTPSHTLGTIIFICNVVAGVSALFAAKLADMIGLIMTMAMTHLPSNVLLMLVPLMPTEFLAIAMLCLRYSISEMDSPTRSAYVQGVVDPDERSAANGVTNVIRSLGAASAPFLSELLYANPAYANFPFYIAGGLKIVYDLLLLWSFSSVRPAGEVFDEAEEMELIDKETTPLVACSSGAMHKVV